MAAIPKICSYFARTAKPVLTRDLVELCSPVLSWLQKENRKRAEVNNTKKIISGLNMCTKLAQMSQI